MLIFLVQKSYAEHFCVTTPIELLFALSDAASNGQSDLIKIAEGNYSITSFNLVYNGIKDFDLEISGGWAPLAGEACGQQLTHSPFNTVLDNSNNRVLKIFSNMQSEIKISNIQFINGFNLNGNGGAINFSDTQIGSIAINNCAFVNNFVVNGDGGALSINSIKLVFSDNLVVENNSITSASLHFTFQANAIGGYIINNTIIANTVEDKQSSLIGGLDINAQGTSKIFVANNVFWDNDYHQISLTGDGYKYLFNNNIAGTASGVAADEESGNFSTIPLFEKGVLSYVPLLESSLINAGFHPTSTTVVPIPFEDDWVLNSNDINGLERVQDHRVDVGAYEAAAEIPIFNNGFEL